MNPIPEDKPALPLEELSITPQWVKAPAKSYEHHTGEDHAPRDGRRPRRDDRDRRSPRGPGRDDRSTSEGGSGFKGAPQPGGNRSPRRDRNFQGRDRRGPRDNRDPRAERPQTPRASVAPVEISFTPEENGFASMINAMKHSPRAYALFDLTRLVLNKPERHVVKIARPAAADGSRAPMFLVIPSEAPFLSQEEATRYVFRRHGNLIFREIKKQIEPPKGNFQFVNRCGFTGEFLGPSNYHGYQNQLIHHHKRRLAHVPFEEFKARIQTVRDEEAVKQWIESMSVTVEYECILDRSEATPATEAPKADTTAPAPAVAEAPVAIDAAASAPLVIVPATDETVPATSQAEAPVPAAAPTTTGKIFPTREALEKHVIANHLSKFIASAPEVRVSGQASRRIDHGGILEAVRLAWESEHKFPLKTANELRPRLRREGFHFFKHHKDITYISGIKTKRFETLAGLSDSVSKLVEFLRANDGIHRKQLAEKFLAPVAVPGNGATAGETVAVPSSPATEAGAPFEADRLLANLHWLIMEGYVVEFSDGRLWALPDRPPQPAPKQEKIESVETKSEAGDVKRPDGPLKLGVIHYNFQDFSFSDFLKYCAATGYEYVELQLPDVWGRDVTDPEQNAEKVRAEVASHGLKVSAFAARNDFVQLDPEAIQFQVARMKRVCGLARILGATVIRTEGGQPKESVPKERWLEAMHACFLRCVPFLDEMQISLAIDNHGLVTNDGDLLFALLQKVGHKRVGTNLDTMNYRWFGHDIATCNRFYEMMAPHTLHLHLKDGFNSRENYKGAALGEGEIDLNHALQCLWKAGYTGVYCAEYEGPELQGGIGYRKCAEWMKARLK